MATKRNKESDVEALRNALVEAEKDNDPKLADNLRHMLVSVQRGDVDWYYQEYTVGNERMRSMQKDLEQIFNLLANEVPFCYAHFNDGESKAIEEADRTISRGTQYVNERLRKALHSALQLDMPNYFVGIPCSYCWGKRKYNKLIENLISGPSKITVTYAVLFLNDNWPTAVNELPRRLANRNVWLVVGQNQDWSTVLDSVEHRVNVPNKNAFQSIDRIYKVYETMPTGAVVLLSCGPMSRVLAANWYYHRPDCTFIDIGSCFDPWTKNERHDYQKSMDDFKTNFAHHCPICNTKGTKHKKG